MNHWPSQPSASTALAVSIGVRLVGTLVCQNSIIHISLRAYSALGRGGSNRLAAVGEDRAAGGGGGSVAEQEDDRLGDLLWLAEAADRMLGGEHRLGFGIETAAGHVGDDEARADTIHP